MSEKVTNNPVKKLSITVALLLVVGWKPLAGQINVDKINTVFGDAGPVTSLHFSLAGKVDNNARLSLSYGGSIADLEKGQAQAPKQLIFSNSDKTLLAFNIRYAYRAFTSYAVMEKNGVLSVIPNIGDVAYGLYLLKHPGQNEATNGTQKRPF